MSESKALDELARELRRPVRGADGWDAIEARLRRETMREPSRQLVPRALLAAAAVLWVAVGIWPSSSATPYLLLEEPELVKLGLERSRLERELASLASDVELRLAAADAGVLTLQSRLEFIESNLENCRRAAAGNGSNRQVQRALLRCLESKLIVVRYLLARTETA